MYGALGLPPLGKGTFTTALHSLHLRLNGGLQTSPGIYPCLPTAGLVHSPHHPTHPKTVSVMWHDCLSGSAPPGSQLSGKKKTKKRLPVNSAKGNERSSCRTRTKMKKKAIIPWSRQDSRHCRLLGPGPLFTATQDLGRSTYWGVRPWT